MASYWVYLNNEVGGPYAVEQLIRLRGFSRHTQVCREDGSGQPNAWTSPSEIPELARIFKSVDEMQDAPTPVRAPARPLTPKPAKPVSRPAVVSAPAAVSKSRVGTWLAWSAFGLLGFGVLAGVAAWLQQTHRQAQLEERHSVQSLIETTSLPSTSRYATPRQCMQEHHIQPQWDFEPMKDGIYHATLSWFTEPSESVPASAVYAFEVNLPAQNLRALNTAATKLLTEGFTAGSNTKAPPPPSPASRFQSTLSDRSQAIQNGDFDTVWSQFSRKKRSEMIQAGISQTGFVRLQSLTHRLEVGQTLTVLKTKEDGPLRRLVLVKQSQDKRPLIFLKQIWIFENNQWKLDSEEKHSEGMEPTPDSDDSSPIPKPTVSAPTAVLAPDEPASFDASAAPSTTTSSAPAPAAKPIIPVQSLPGISN